MWSALAYLTVVVPWYSSSFWQWVQRCLQHCCICRSVVVFLSVSRPKPSDVLKWLFYGCIWQGFGMTGWDTQISGKTEHVSDRKFHARAHLVDLVPAGNVVLYTVVLCLLILCAAVAAAATTTTTITFCFHSFFTVRRNVSIASTVLATAIPSIHLSVLSVHLSHAGIVSKWLHVARCSLHCQIVKCVLFSRNQKNVPGTTPSPWNLGSNWSTPSWKQRLLTCFAL